MTNFNPSRRSLLGALLAGLFGWVSSAKAIPSTPPQMYPLAGQADAFVPGVGEHTVKQTVMVLIRDSTGSSAQSFNWTINKPQ